jgi:hypothetical protein
VAPDPHFEALATVTGDFNCPSFNGNQFVDLSTRAEAITNYKVLAATHIQSYQNRGLYGTDAMHPDGGIHPGGTIGLGSFKRDGTSRTLIAVESTEQNFARWTVGLECAVVGLPTIPGAAPVVEFSPTSTFPYFHLVGYVPNQFWDQSRIEAKPYMAWDYRYPPEGDGQYDEGTATWHAIGVKHPSNSVSMLADPAPAGASEPQIRAGPGSDHSGGVVNHLCADGSVHSISPQVDCSLMMFMITRDNGDPMPGFEPN